MGVDFDLGKAADFMDKVIHSVTFAQAEAAAALVAQVANALAESGIPRSWYTIGAPTIQRTVNGIEATVRVQWMEQPCFYKDEMEQVNRAIHHVNPASSFACNDDERLTYVMEIL